jgi:serine/threonine protein kinase
MQVGDTLGHYELRRELGSGAFGTVFLGVHRLDATQVAIKVLTGLEAAQARLKLWEEANHHRMLEHQHIVRFIGYISTPVAHLTMQYASNGSLSDYYPLGQPQPLETILPHVRQIAEGLQHMHDLNMLHLDLKPNNILLDEQDEALITDFGLALFLPPGSREMPLAQMRGNAVFAAPETCQGRVGKASDQYALAMMVYQWLSGKLPFADGDYMLDVVRAKIHRDAPLLSTIVPTLPLAVNAVVMQALSRIPGRRFALVMDFYTALAAAAAGLLPAQA